ncbi:MAG: hypothetical protein ACI39U_03980, partial [Candidatus Cryptobacteroides sp.]
MLIIADCGATKADWAVIRGGKLVKRLSTGGFNAAVGKTAEPAIREFSESLKSSSIGSDGTVQFRFYCAGAVSEGMSYGIRKCLGDFFEGAEVEVFSDMLGAARAV